MRRLLLPVLTALAAAGAAAQQPTRPAQPMRAAPMAMRAGIAPGGNPAQRLLVLRTQLGLGDDQVARLQQLATAQAQTLTPPRPAMLRARADLLEATQKDDLDAAHAAMERMARLRTDAAFARLKAASDARRVLTADQKARLQQLQAARRMRAGGMPRLRGGMPRGGGGTGMDGMPCGMRGMGDAGMGGPGMGPGMGGPGMGGPAMQGSGTDRPD